MPWVRAHLLRGTTWFKRRDYLDRLLSGMRPAMSTLYVGSVLRGRGWDFLGPGGRGLASSQANLEKRSRSSNCKGIYTTLNDNKEEKKKQTWMKSIKHGGCCASHRKFRSYLMRAAAIIYFFEPACHCCLRTYPYPFLSLFRPQYNNKSLSWDDHVLYQRTALVLLHWCRKGIFTFTVTKGTQYMNFNLTCFDSSDTT